MPDDGECRIVRCQVCFSFHRTIDHPAGNGDAYLVICPVSGARHVYAARLTHVIKVKGK